jgi:hypothetical protein
MNGARDGEPPGDPRVRYDAAHRVLICPVCQSGVSPSQGLLRHLQRYHKSWPLAARRDLVRAIGAVPLLEPHAVAPPAPEAPAVRGLPTRDGWQCRRCGHLCASEGSMREHARRSHR